MEKSKEDQLKAILNKTLSSQEIEQKLKKEINKKTEKTIINNKRQKEKNLNRLLYSVIVLVIILQIILIYLLTYTPSKEKNKIIQTKIEKINPAKEKIVLKEKTITKIEDLTKNNFKKFYNSREYNTLKCYEYAQGRISPNKACKKSIDKFLLDNKNALRFEIIPVVGESDYLFFNKLEEKIQTLDKKYKDKIKDYMLKGLSIKRVLEISWDIKEKLGEDTIITPTNYYVVSQKDNKGVIVKAYY